MIEKKIHCSLGRWEPEATSVERTWNIFKKKTRLTQEEAARQSPEEGETASQEGTQEA